MHIFLFANFILLYLIKHFKSQPIYFLMRSAIFILFAVFFISSLSGCLSNSSENISTTPPQPETIENLIYTVSTSSIKLSWNTTATAACSICWGRFSTSENSLQVPGLSTTFEVTVENLLPDRDYKLEIKALFLDNSVAKQLIKFRTEASAFEPAQPVQIETAHLVATSSIYVKWFPSSSFNFVRYWLCYSTNEKNFSFYSTSCVKVASIENRYITEKTISNLKDGFTYYFRVFIEDKNQTFWGSNIYPVNIPTFDWPPPAPTVEVREVYTYFASFKIEYPAIDDFSTLEIYRGSELVYSTDEMIKTFVDSPLEDNATYIWTFVIKDKGGNSSSATIEATTLPIGQILDYTPVLYVQNVIENSTNSTFWIINGNRLLKFKATQELEELTLPNAIIDASFSAPTNPQDDFFVLNSSYLTWISSSNPNTYSKVLNSSPLKVSSDSDKIAVCYQNSNVVDVFNFYSNTFFKTASRFTTYNTKDLILLYPYLFVLTTQELELFDLSSNNPSKKLTVSSEAKLRLAYNKIVLIEGNKIKLFTTSSFPTSILEKDFPNPVINVESFFSKLYVITENEIVILDSLYNVDYSIPFERAIGVAFSPDIVHPKLTVIKNDGIYVITDRI